MERWIKGKEGIRCKSYCLNSFNFFNSFNSFNFFNSFNSPKNKHLTFK